MVNTATEPLSSQKQIASDMVICSDLPSKRQHVSQSDAEGFFEVVKADHQPHQEQ